MQAFLAFRSDANDPLTEHHVSIAIDKRDLSLSPQDFAMRFLVPAWTVIKAKVEGEDKENG